jgi:hypothetical protein
MGERVDRSAAVRGGRAAVVVPNGTLFGDGISAVIKEEMLKEFRLHTIVRLPQGVFAPYTDIPANLLFFERAARPTPSGTTNCRCRKAARSTARPPPCSSRNSLLLKPGGMPVKKARRPGR